jgi:hypothetical protein
VDKLYHFKLEVAQGIFELRDIATWLMKNKAAADLSNDS